MTNCNRKSLKEQAVEEAMERHDGLVHAFIQRQGGGAISYEDALHAGRIGLWRAIRGYDPERGTRFSTYAWVAICNQIHQAVQAEARERQRPTLELADVLPWREEIRAEQFLEQEEINQALAELVSRMPDRLRQVIQSRYGLDGVEKETLGAMGLRLGVCSERVRQLEEDALAWLRHPARSWHLRQLLERNTAVDYRRALAQNAALRRRRGGRR
jgi:RNA polymerase sigma factor (sigma-70 family)